MLPGLEPDAIDTIITLSTPHTQPPTPFDKRIIDMYSAIRQYWLSAFAAPSHPLHNVALISISGGTGDTMVPSDTCSTSSFAPSSNTMTVFTTGVTGLYSPVDHQAMVWCDQLRKRIAAALLDILDAQLPHKTKSLDERMAIFRHYLLGLSHFQGTERQSLAFSQSITLPDHAFEALHVLSSQPLQVHACSGNECSVPSPGIVQEVPLSRPRHHTTTKDSSYWLHTLQKAAIGTASAMQVSASSMLEIWTSFSTSDVVHFDWTLTGEVQCKCK